MKIVRGRNFMVSAFAPPVDPEPEPQPGGTDGSEGTPPPVTSSYTATHYINSAVAAGATIIDSELLEQQWGTLTDYQKKYAKGILLPGAGGEGKLFAFNNANASSVAINFTRSTTGMRVIRKGWQEFVGINEPRFAFEFTYRSDIEAMVAAITSPANRVANGGKARYVHDYIMSSSKPKVTDGSVDYREEILAALSASGSEVVFPAYPILGSLGTGTVGQLTFPNNKTFLMLEGGELRIQAGISNTTYPDSGYEIVNGRAKTNQTFINFKVRGDYGNGHTGSIDTEQGFGFMMKGSTGLRMYNCYAYDTMSDGFYFGYQTRTGDDTEIWYATGVNNGRNNFSNCGSKNFWAVNCQGITAHKNNPATSFDFEPGKQDALNSPDGFENVNIINFTGTDAKRSGVQAGFSEFSNWGSPLKTMSITFKGLYVHDTWLQLWLSWRIMGDEDTIERHISGSIKFEDTYIVNPRWPYEVVLGPAVSAYGGTIVRPYGIGNCVVFKAPSTGNDYPMLRETASDAQLSLSFKRNNFVVDGAKLTQSETEWVHEGYSSVFGSTPITITQ